MKARGHFFEYELIHMGRLGATVRYNDLIYRPGAYSFESFRETDEVQTMVLQPSQLDAGHESWQKANAKVNAKLYAERKVLKAAQIAADIDTKRVFNFEDIDSFFQKNGRGTHLLEFEFNPDTPAPVSYVSGKSGMTNYFWCWTHKLTKVSVKRFATASGKAADSGRLSKYLSSITERQNPLAFARAQKILLLNDSNGVITIDEPEKRVVLTRRELLAQQVSPVVWQCGIWHFHSSTQSFLFFPFR